MSASGQKANSDSPIQSLHRLWRKTEGGYSPCFQKRASFSVPAAASGYQTFGVRLTVA